MNVITYSTYLGGNIDLCAEHADSPPSWVPGLVQVQYGAHPGKCAVSHAEPLTDEAFEELRREAYIANVITYSTYLGGNIDLCAEHADSPPSWVPGLVQVQYGAHPGKCAVSHAEPLTDEALEELRREAYIARDLATAACATVALGEELSPAVLDSRDDPAVARWVRHPGDRADARVVCAEIVREARALREED